MSAYALPGLFPPIQTSVTTETGSASSTFITDFGLGPLHEQAKVATKSTLEQTCAAFTSPYVLTHTKKDVVSSKVNRPGIHVTEAFVDPVRLVRSLTRSLRTKGLSGKKSQLRRRNSKERKENSSKDTCSKSETSKSRGDEDIGRVGAPHDEAIEFALAISFNGRKYTAKRTMQRILQLRDDLISEMDDRRRWLVLRKSKEKNSYLDPLLDGDDCDYANVQIPEIPPLAGDEDGTGIGAGFVGRGFSMLHAMASSYVPTMERWLRSVLAVVPQDSECLMNFLWEPLSHDSPTMDSPVKSCVSLATLGSIKELECATDDDSDSEDEWEG